MIIHRAFIREVLQTCTAVMAILFSIFLVTRLVGFLNEAVAGDAPLDQVFLLLLLKMMTYLDILVPLVLYISILLVMGRWARDNELTVISACGIGIQEFVRPVLVLFAIVGTMVAAFSLYIAPLSAEIFQSIQHEHRSRSDTTGIIPGVFTGTRTTDGVYFVERYNRQTDVFFDIFVYNEHEGQDEIVIASSGYKTVDEKTGDDFFVLTNGTQYRAVAGSSDYSMIDFENYAVRLKQPATDELRLPVKAKSTLALLEDPGRSAVGEFHWRISKIAMLPVLMLFALSFSSVRYRKTRFPGVLVALLVYFGYSNVLGLVVALIRKGTVHPHLSLWIAHLVFFFLAMYLFRRRHLNLRLIPRLPG